MLFQVCDAVVGHPHLFVKYAGFLLQPVGALHQAVVLVHPLGELVQLVGQQSLSFPLLKDVVHQADQGGRPGGDQRSKNGFRPLSPLSPIAVVPPL